VDIFRTSPDFDESKTEYQVKFAKDKGYDPHSCSKLKSLALCKAREYKDEICLEGYYSRTQEEQKKIKHPLSYVSIKEFRNSKARDNPDSKTKEDIGENAND
jgi:DNA primase large subunit